MSWPEDHKFVRSDIEEIEAIVEQIAPLLVGRPCAVQGGVILELYALWLSGHRAKTPERTEVVRKRLAAAHTDAALKLARVFEEAGENMDAPRRLNS